MINFGLQFEDEAQQAFHWAAGENAALLIHGYPGTPAEMRPVAKILHEMNCTVRGMLLPGFGSEIEHLAEKTHQDWLMAVEKNLLDLQANYQNVILVGYSMGAALALNVAAKHDVERLILFSPFVEINHVLWKSLPLVRFFLPKIKIFRIMKPNFADQKTREGIAKFMPSADIDEPKVQEAILNFELPIGMFDEIRQLGYLSLSAAKHIHVPTLVFQGLQDELVRVDKTRELIKRIKSRVEYCEVNAPHEILNPALAEWAKIEAAIREFVLGTTS